MLFLNQETRAFFKLCQAVGACYRAKNNPQRAGGHGINRGMTVTPSSTILNATVCICAWFDARNWTTGIIMLQALLFVKSKYNYDGKELHAAFCRAKRENQTAKDKSTPRTLSHLQPSLGVWLWAPRARRYPHGAKGFPKAKRTEEVHWIDGLHGT